MKNHCILLVLLVAACGEAPSARDDDLRLRRDAAPALDSDPPRTTATLDAHFQTVDATPSVRDAGASTCALTDVRGPFVFSNGDGGVTRPVVALGLTCQVGCFHMDARSANISVCRDSTGAITCQSSLDPRAGPQFGYDCCVRMDDGYQCYWFDVPAPIYDGGRDS